MGARVRLDADWRCCYGAFVMFSHERFAAMQQVLHLGKRIVAPPAHA
jgi:hypothetical protein